MNKLMKAIETLMGWIGHDKRSGDDRRVKVKKRKTTKRKTTRRKK